MDFVLGLFGGYLLVSVCESLFHRTIQHASPRLRRVHRHLGTVGNALRRAWFAHHVVHHHMTFRVDHVTQFSSNQEQLRLDDRLRQKGEADVIQTEYGARIGPELSNYFLYVTPTLPIFAVFCWLGGVGVTVGALIPFVVWPMLAQFVHPYIHKSDVEVRSHPSRWVRMISATGYFRRLRVHHWLHHRYETCNYNLLMGGDWFLGCHRSANADDFTEMRRIGLIGKAV